MKNSIFVSVILLFLINVGKSQSCLPNGITFTSQEEIDSFQINYPNCSEIEGDVVIEGENILNLDSLSIVTKIGGKLWIYNNSELNNLAGLENLFFVGSYFHIFNNNSLTTLEGLENLDSTGSHFTISYNQSLTSLVGIDNLNSIGGDLSINDNSSLTSLEGLENLNSIGNALRIHHCIFTDLTGLENIDQESIQYLSISHNPVLSNCAIQNICDYLINDGYSNIYSNIFGCSSEEQIIDACITSNKELSEYLANEIIIYPNPTKDFFSIEISSGLTIREVILLNQFGQLINQYEFEGKPIDISFLSKGLYYLRIKIKDQIIFKKLIKQ